MKHLLLVEDNPTFREVATAYLKPQVDILDVTTDYLEARLNLQLGGITGVITDVFFPQRGGSGVRDEGLALVQRMRDVLGESDTCTARAITQVGNTVGIEAAKLFTRNAGRKYAQEVDKLWALEKAIEEDEANQPLGLLVAEQAQQLGIPFVLATSTYHHDILTQPVQDYCGKKGWTLVDCGPNSVDEKSNARFWERVFDVLVSKF